MKFTKNKILISILIIIVTMFILPLLIVNNIDSLSAMGWILIFFFIINPIISIGLGIYNGLELHKSYFIPLLVFAVFPILYWIILQDVIYELFIYSTGYMIISFIAMLITTVIIKKKTNK